MIWSSLKGFSIMFKYKLTIAYDGTSYSGWQVQPHDLSIQQVLQKAMGIILRRPIVLTGSGRTDAGVHAAGQIAHFKHDTEIDLYRFHNSLNSLIPHDIRVIVIEPVSLDFHAQYSAVGKEYHYHLYLDKVMDPFRRHYCWHLHQPLDDDLLRQAAALFVGTHDFTSFANEAHRGSASKDPVRTLKRLTVVEELGGLRLEFEADGFLYKMVRNSVGTLVDVASGKRPLGDVVKIFSARDRRQGSMAAPPQGLFLMNVQY
jgi:tRNA pseudouridine38-40 synthase